MRLFPSPKNRTMRGPGVSLHFWGIWPTVRRCSSAQPAAVLVGNTWSLDITAVRPRDYIEESGMGGGREQLVHHYVLVAAAVCAFAAGDRRSQLDEPRQPSRWCRSESSRCQFIPPKHPKHLDFLKRRSECDIFCRNWVLPILATRWRATMLSACKLYCKI